MIEKITPFSTGVTKRIEKVIDDDPVMINHMILPTGQGLPEHYANSNVYMVIVKGLMSLRLDDQEAHQYPAGEIITIPFHTLMNVNNFADELLEFFVVKAPNPRCYQPAVK